MNISLKKAPTTDSFSALESRLQQVEQAGSGLISLSCKILDDRTQVNVAGFSTEPPPLGILKLVPTPADLAVAEEPDFIADLLTDGSTFVKMADLVLSKTPTRVAVIRGPVSVLPAVAVTPAAAATLEGITLSWDNDVRRAWSQELVRAISLRITLLEQGKADNFVAGYSGLSFDNRVKFWCELLVAMSKHESDWVAAPRPSLESDGQYSRGLLQLSYGDARNYPLEPLSPARGSLEDPLVNLRCAVIILARLVSRDKTVERTSGKSHFGAAAYWSVIRAGSSHFLEDIRSRVKTNLGL